MSRLMRARCLLLQSHTHTHTFPLFKKKKIPFFVAFARRREEEERRRAEEEAKKAALTAEEEEQLANQAPPVLPYSSMFIFSSTNAFRCAIHAVVTFPLFDVAIMLVIIASSISLAAEDPVNELSERNIMLNKLDKVFTFIFGFEVLLKVGDVGTAVTCTTWLCS